MPGLSKAGNNNLVWLVMGADTTITVKVHAAGLVTEQAKNDIDQRIRKGENEKFERSQIG
jgi:hypothetical protein